jgi:hypothetical protein
MKQPPYINSLSAAVVERRSSFRRQARALMTVESRELSLTRALNAMSWAPDQPRSWLIVGPRGAVPVR